MTFTGTLRPYQEDAVDFMVRKRKVLVAFDMGTGKTPMTIAAIEALRDDHSDDGLRDGHLTMVVCLSSLKYQWQKEIAKFSDSTSIVIDGTKAQRAEQYAQANDYDYVIVNYEQVVNDWDQFPQMRLGAMVLDEATAVKSFRAKRTKRAKDLSRLVDVRYALTGTPIENGKPEELYSIMNVVNYKVLGARFDLFDRTFIVRDRWGGVDRYRNLDRLHERLKTCSVRKAQTDPDVAPFLPDEIVRDPIVVPLDRAGAVVYRHISGLLLEDLDEVLESFGSTFSLEAHYGVANAPFNGAEMAIRGRLMSKITALRMLCDHPALLVTSASKWNPMVADEGSKFLSDLLEDEPDLKDMLNRAKAPKLDMLVTVVKDHLAAEDVNKIVVFTSYVDMAHWIHDMVGGVVYTGKMNAKQKEAAKEKFQTDPDCRVFISTDAGGYGVDLPQANMLVNYDMPWSSGLAVQRNARIKRVSSPWPSIVIQDLLTADSTEIHYHRVLRQKNSIADAIIDGRGINAKGGVDLTVGALAAFLRETQP